jgi:phospholipase/carboxylesterase
VNYTNQKPKNQSSAAPPVLIIFHGYGADEFDLLPIASKLDPSFLTISLQAPIELTWGGHAWYHLEQSSSGLKSDSKSRIVSEDLLIESLHEIIKKEGGDPNQIYLMGFSQGSAMCYSLIGRHNLQNIGLNIRGVIIMSGYIPEDVIEPLRKKDLSSIPFFLSHGIHDDLIPAIAMKVANDILEKAGAKTFAKDYEIGHGLTEETVSDIRKWIDNLLHH